MKKGPRFAQSVGILALLVEGAPEPEVHGRVIRFGLERPLQLHNRFVVAAKVYQMPAVKTAKQKIQWIELQRARGLHLCLQRPSHREQEIRVEEMRVGVVAVQLNCSLIRLFGALPVPFGVKLDAS